MTAQSCNRILFLSFSSAQRLEAAQRLVTLSNVPNNIHAYQDYWSDSKSDDFEVGSNRAWEVEEFLLAMQGRVEARFGAPQELPHIEFYGFAYYLR